MQPWKGHPLGFQQKKSHNKATLVPKHLVVCVVCVVLVLSWCCLVLVCGCVVKLGTHSLSLLLSLFPLLFPFRFPFLFLSDLSFSISFSSFSSLAPSLTSCSFSCSCSCSLSSFFSSHHQTLCKKTINQQTSRRSNVIWHTAAAQH